MSTTVQQDSVRRLVDIVVEEVSLVDRAANQRRFLIVKRGEPMDERQFEKADGSEDAAVGEASVTVEEGSDVSDEPAEGDESAMPDNSLLEVAVNALERLTETVEALSTVGDNSARSQLAEIAGDLRALAERLVSATGGSTAQPEPAKAADIVGVLETVRETLQQVGSLIDASKAAKAKPKKAPLEDGTSAACKGASSQRTQDDIINRHLHRLTEAMGKVALNVHEQSQRLTKLEKSFGLPHSTPAKEGQSRTTAEDVGWPMDLNRPCDRENVDKAVSFHEL
jgi:hypothetical protein